MEKRTPTEIKNQVAQRHGCNTWMDILDKFSLCGYSYSEINALENEAILEYANQCKEAQRESDAKAAEKFYHEKGHSFDTDSILNNPLVTDKTD